MTLVNKYKETFTKLSKDIDKPTYLTTQDLVKNTTSWSTDVWALGSILLEIVMGCPLWIPLTSDNEPSSLRLACGDIVDSNGLLGCLPEERTYSAISNK